MYKQLIEAYYRDDDEKTLWFVENKPEMVFIAHAGTMEGTLYETKQSCFEEHVKPSIEDCYEPEDFRHVFTEEELDFMATHYPNTPLAGAIAEARNIEA